jgi:hypothetical protein
MNARELILLSPFRLPGPNPLLLGSEDMAAFLNGYLALWHPAALAGAASLPRVASAYDYEQPSAGHVYAVPESPPLFLPDDWDERVREAGAVAFRAGPDRAATLENLRQALETSALSTQHSALSTEVGPFFGIGLGYLVIDTLYEAMEHEKMLAEAELLHDLQEGVTALAAGGPDAEDLCRRHLQAAADRLLAAREVLYPVTIYLIDLFLPAASDPGAAWPASFEKGQALNVLASAEVLERLGRDHPDRLEALRQRLSSDLAEVCGGPYREAEDALLPVEAQLANLTRGLAVSRELLGQDLRVFGRRRFAAHPQLPLFLHSAGLHRALLLTFDEAVLPTYRTTVVNWPSPDGKQVEAFARTPYPADQAQTFFHLAHYLHKTIMQDQSATVALVHKGTPAGPWYDDWLELSRFGPVLGQWVTLSRYLGEVLAGEYASAAAADSFHSDYLNERTTAQSEQPVSWFARHARQRRRLDTAWTLTALHCSLAGPARADAAEAASPSRMEDRLVKLEDQMVAGEGGPGEDLAVVEKEAAEALAGRLLARAVETPGYLVLNPCSFTRRVALEVDGIAGPLPLTGPLKACQLDGDKARLVVEVPPLGFAWFPRSGPPGTPPPASRMRLADQRCVRNEFFEAEIDPATGGLRAIRDHRTRINRLGQQLVFNPGSQMRVSAVKVNSTGPALGEIVTEGALLGEEEQVLAKFRQRFRAWLGRPVLELRIEIYPEHAPQGYPWHAYYGARFAWRDERATLLRGVNGTNYITTHTRPQTPDYLEVRQARQSTVLFPGGLPFHQRHEGRMLDMILIPEGETCRTFDLALGLDRDYPMQTALGMITPAPLVPVAKGPPHVGAAGWLFHLDAPNLVLTSLKPAANGADAVIARLLECAAYSGQAELRCVRNPSLAVLLDAAGNTLMDASVNGDAVSFETAPGDLVQLRIEFG